MVGFVHPLLTPSLSGALHCISNTLLFTSSCAVHYISTRVTFERLQRLVWKELGRDIKTWLFTHRIDCSRYLTTFFSLYILFYTPIGQIAGKLMMDKRSLKLCKDSMAWNLVTVLYCTYYLISPALLILAHRLQLHFFLLQSDNAGEKRKKTQQINSLNCLNTRNGNWLTVFRFLWGTFVLVSYIALL